MSNNNLPADVQEIYNPIGCEHKLPNGLTAWSWFSESSGSGPELNYRVCHAVCSLCGEIRVTGHRWDGKSKHVDRFDEIIHVYHPDTIDAIIKQANFFNEGEIWGRTEELQQENEKLKEGVSELKEQSIDYGKRLIGMTVEHQALKEQAEKMAEALERVCKSGAGYKYRDTIKMCEAALSEWNSEQKEVGNG